MNYLWKIFAIISFGMLIFPGVSSSQENINENVGTRGLGFLKIGVGAEAIGMGESHVAQADNLFASYWNPAGLSMMQRAQLGFMHNRWFEGINHEFIGYVHPLSTFGVVATSFSYLSFGELERRDADGNLGKPFRPYDLALVFSYGRKFTSDFAAGVNLKLLREQIDDKKAQAIAFDLGGKYDVPHTKLTLGVNFQNFGTKIKFVEESFALPLNLKVGMAYGLLDNSLAIAADLNHPWDNDVNLGFGIEYTPIKLFHLRSGYRYSLGGNDLGAVSGLTAGLGLSIESYQIDYAFVSFGKLGPTHRVSVLANF